MKTTSNFTLVLIKNIATIVFVILISLTSMGQTMQVKEALACIGLTKTSAFNKVKSIGYSYKGIDTDFYEFSKDIEYYRSDLTLAVTNSHCNMVSWNVHIFHANRLMSDVLSSGFELNEQGTRFNVRAYKNYEKRLVLTLIERTSIDNMIIVTIGRMASDE